MAGRAFVFILRVALDDGSGHQYSFEHLSGRRTRIKASCEYGAHYRPSFVFFASMHECFSTAQYMCTARMCTSVAKTRM
jgi:hypothetical protein